MELLNAFDPGDSSLLLRMVELVLLASLIELCWLSVRGQAAPSGWLPNLLAGFHLALALRLGLGGADTVWVAACLAAAGCCHLLDLRARLRGPPVSSPAAARGSERPMP